MGEQRRGRVTTESIETRALTRPVEPERNALGGLESATRDGVWVAERKGPLVRKPLRNERNRTAVGLRAYLRSLDIARAARRDKSTTIRTVPFSSVAVTVGCGTAALRP